MRAQSQSRTEVAAFVALVLTFALLTASSSAARADATIDVAISTIGETWIGFLPGVHEVTVTNSGTEPLEAVTVTAFGSLLAETLSGPSVVVGNSDDVLDPNEEWRYAARSCGIEPAVVDVTASTSSGSTVSASASIQIPASRPIEATIVPNAEAVVAGDTVEWVADVTNLTNAVLDYREATGALWAGSSDTNSGAPITEESPMTLFRQGEDGDDSWHPGETWRWSYRAVVAVDGSFLVATFLFNNCVGAVSGIQEGSGPIVVAPAPSTTVVETTLPETTVATTIPTLDPLPKTGTSTTAAGVAALGTVLLGALLIAATRRRVGNRGQS